MIGWLVYLWGLKRAPRPESCCVCGVIGATSCLPFLGPRRFCVSCARRIVTAR